MTRVIIPMTPLLANVEEDHYYVLSTSTCSAHQRGSNTLNVMHQAEPTECRKKILRFKKCLESAGVAGKDSPDLKREGINISSGHFLTTQLKGGDRK